MRNTSQLQRPDWYEHLKAEYKPLGQWIPGMQAAIAKFTDSTQETQKLVDQLGECSESTNNPNAYVAAIRPIATLRAALPNKIKNDQAFSSAYKAYQKEQKAIQTAKDSLVNVDLGSSAEAATPSTPLVQKDTSALSNHCWARLFCLPCCSPCYVGTTPTPRHSRGESG